MSNLLTHKAFTENISNHQYKFIVDASVNWNLLKNKKDEFPLSIALKKYDKIHPFSNNTRKGSQSLIADCFAVAGVCGGESDSYCDIYGYCEEQVCDFNAEYIDQKAVESGQYTQSENQYYYAFRRCLGSKVSIKK